LDEAGQYDVAERFVEEEQFGVVVLFDVAVGWHV
jgi:hypothetical protein